MADSWGGALAGLRGRHDPHVMQGGTPVPYAVSPPDLLRVLIEHTSDVVTVVAADGTITYQSPSCRRVLGHEPEELLGTSSFDLVHPDDLSRVMAMFAERIAIEGVTPPVRVRCRRKDGSWIDLEAVGNNLLSQPEAQVTAAIARVGQELISCLDTPLLLERLCRVTTEVLRCDFSETRFWDATRDAFVPVSEFGVTSEEREALRPISIPRKMLSFELKDVWHGRIDEIESQHIVGLGRRFGVTGVVVIPLRRGSELLGILSAAFRGREARFSGPQLQIARAIGQLAAMALENARLVEELQRASRLKSEFVATMSHELRTPLNVIIGYTDLLIEESFGPMSSEQRQVCRRVERSAEELLELINATLDLGRLESGRLRLELQEISVAQIAAIVERETQELCEKPNVLFRWLVAPDVPVMRTDALKVKVILKNLIANAIKFTPAGEIEIAINAEGSGVELLVRDTGIGIAAETQTIIFEPFRQADGSMSRRFGGVGLGLYVVRRLVEALGGVVTVNSEVGHGSTFRVYLPSAGPR